MIFLYVGVVTLLQIAIFIFNFVLLNRDDCAWHHWVFGGDWTPWCAASTTVKDYVLIGALGLPISLGVMCMTIRIPTAHDRNLGYIVVLPFQKVGAVVAFCFVWTKRFWQDIDDKLGDLQEKMSYELQIRITEVSTIYRVRSCASGCLSNCFVAAWSINYCVYR